MVSIVEDDGGEGREGVCREAWSGRCDGSSIDLLGADAATWIECKLCCLAQFAPRSALLFFFLYSQMIWLMEFVVYNFTGSQDTQGDCWLGCVHVQDVAEAHVLLYETAAASGRYLCTNGIYQFKDFATKVAELYPQYPVHR